MASGDQSALERFPAARQQHSPSKSGAAPAASVNSPKDRYRGRLTKWTPSKSGGWGIITVPGGGRAFLHRKEIQHGEPVVGCAVEFGIRLTGNLPYAIGVILVSVSNAGGAAAPSAEVLR